MAMEMSREQKKEVNDYEEMRNKRIQQNMQRMMALGIHKTMSTIQTTIHKSAPPPKLPRTMSPRTPKNEEPSRRSLRAQNQPVPSYAELHCHLEYEVARAEKARGRGGDAATELERCKHRIRAEASKREPKNDWPTEATVLATAGAAEVSALQAQGPAFVKLMLPSHIAGGYWLQAPYGIHHYLPSSSCMITLVCEGEEWQVVWLVPKMGLSGGWRGFAIDQRLAVGDACVFEKLPGLRLGITIHRVVKSGGDMAAAEAAFNCAEHITSNNMGAPRSQPFVTVDEAPMLESQQEEGSPVDTNPTPRADVQEDSEQGDKGGLLLPNGGTVARMHIHSRRRAGSREVTFLAAGRIRARATVEEARRMAQELITNDVETEQESPAPEAPLTPSPSLEHPQGASETQIKALEAVDASRKRKAMCGQSIERGWLNAKELEDEYNRVTSQRTPSKKGRASPQEEEESVETTPKQTAVQENQRRASVHKLKPLSELYKVVRSSKAPNKGGPQSKTVAQDTTSSATDTAETYGHRSVGRRVSCLWPMENEWYSGVLISYSPRSRTFRVQYDDGDYEDGVALPDDTVKVL